MLTLFLIFPALAIAAIVAKAPPKGAALLATGANLVLGVYFACHFVPGGFGFQFEQSFAWAGGLGSIAGLPPIHYHVGLDGISLPLVLLSALVSFCAVAVTPRDIERGAEFFACVLLISLGVTGAFFSLDLFFLYIFHEFALVPAFLLIGIWGLGNRQFASFQLTLYLTLGSLILLAGVIAVGVAYGTFDLAGILGHAPGRGVYGIDGSPAAFVPASGTAFPHGAVFGLFLVGCGILVSLVPFHSWAPPGYASAPPAAAMLHAGVLKKFGLYVLLRVAWPLFPEAAQQWMPLLLTLVLLHVFYVGLVALAQKELGTMLAYSSIMHMGYLFLGLLAWNRLGVSGLVFLMVAHGLSTALLFALYGEIVRRTGEVRLAHLGGLAKPMPFLASMFVLGAMAALGLPALPNFTGELLIFFGAWKAHPVVTACVLWGAVITAVFLLRAVRDIFFGPLPEKFAGVADLRGWDRAPYLLLGAAIVAVGVAPGILLQWIQPAVDALLAGGVR